MRREVKPDPVPPPKEWKMRKPCTYNNALFTKGTKNKYLLASSSIVNFNRRKNKLFSLKASVISVNRIKAARKLEYRHWLGCVAPEKKKLCPFNF